MSHQPIPPISDKTEVILDHVTFITMESEIPNLPALMERKTVIVPWYSSYHPPEFEVNGVFFFKEPFLWKNKRIMGFIKPCQKYTEEEFQIIFEFNSHCEDYDESRIVGLAIDEDNPDGIVFLS